MIYVCLLINKCGEYSTRIYDILIKSVKNETLSTEDLQNVNCNKKKQHVSISIGPQEVHVMSC